MNYTKKEIKLIKQRSFEQGTVYGMVVTIALFIVFSIIYKFLNQ